VGDPATDVATAVVSMSAAHPEGRDDEYVAWHLLDHLPEQYRLPGLRLGQRWRSTPELRAARAASEPPYDAVDHVVQYQFGEPVGPALDAFFALGAELHAAGRMPISLPSVQLGGWDLSEVAAAERVLVDAAVVPWRPATGAYLVIEAEAGTPLAALAAVPGVAGGWRYAGTGDRHERLASTAGHVLTVCWLDEQPVEVAAAIAQVLGGNPLLAAPFGMPTP
jgi:hypothetical protein